MNGLRSWLHYSVVALAPLAIAACSTSVARNAVPIGLADQVDVEGVSQVRHWGDVPIPNVKQMARLRIKQVREHRPSLLKAKNAQLSLLAISGGGSDGAYGAGLLNGWTASGSRPSFEVVTGVSAGALSAPFAFLGPEYDSQLKEVFTIYATEDILTPQLLSGIFGGSAVSDSAPLARLIEKYMTRSTIQKIAAEYRKGRRLFVGTTNLDSERPVVWDMGAIANKDTKASRQLFRKILLASASIPAAFPPIFIKVEVDGKTYEEMHVDGGTTDNAFLLPPGFNAREGAGPRGQQLDIQLYIIANSKLSPSAEIVKANTFAIAGRSISTLIKQQLDGDLLKIYLRSRANETGFSLTWIPSDFQEVSQDVFDVTYMGKLYEVGYARGRSNNHWRPSPPGL
ncbi:MAG: patatin-like phospholipase family protein [Pseudomonadota bacterium]